MRLRYVVVDELHTLRGIFGSHVAHLLRRLRRSAPHYGSSTRPSSSRSATIGEPGRLASELCGLAGRAEVTDDGSPRGERLVVLWNPAGRRRRRAAGPRRRPARPPSSWRPGRAAGTAPSPSAAAARAPSSSPPTCGAACRADLADAVRPYRGGYLAAERREIEDELFGGSLRGRGGHHRPRARHRRRRPRRLRAQRLPRHHRLDVAAGRAGPGASGQAVDRRARGRRRPARPVVHGATPTSCSPARPSRRWSTRPTRTCCSPTCACAAYELPLTPPTSAGGPTCSTTACAAWCSTTS